MTTRQVFYQVGNTVLNQYEVRSVTLKRGAKCKMVGHVVYKDGSKTTISGAGLHAFVAGLTQKPTPKATDWDDETAMNWEDDWK